MVRTIRLMNVSRPSIAQRSEKLLPNGLLLSVFTNS